MSEELPPSKPLDQKRKQTSLRRSYILLAGTLCVALVVTVPVIIREKEKARQASAVSNLRQIGMCLFEFDVEYGRLPDRDTAVEIKRVTGSPLTLSDSTSNDVFVQLLASGIARSEQIFSTYTTGTIKPDGNWDSDATALESGESDVAYIARPSLTGGPDPILFGPVAPGARMVDHKAVVLKIDNSVASFSTNSKGSVPFNGTDFLDPAHPLWNGKTPDVKWPK